MNNEYVIIGMSDCQRCKSLWKRLPDLSMYIMPSTPLGLGDVIARITDKLHLHECSACRVRHNFLNKLFPNWIHRATPDEKRIRALMISSGHTRYPVIMDEKFTHIISISKVITEHTTSQNEELYI